MRTSFFGSIVFLLLALVVSVALAGDFAQKIKEAAVKRGVKEVKTITALVKSIDKQSNQITIYFDGMPQMGSQLVRELKFQFRKKPDELFDIPEDTKEVKIYWGYDDTGFDLTIGLEKVR